MRSESKGDEVSVPSTSNDTVFMSSFQPLIDEAIKLVCYRICSRVRNFDQKVYDQLVNDDDVRDSIVENLSIRVESGVDLETIVMGLRLDAMFLSPGPRT